MCTSVRSLNSCLSVSLRCAERCAASRIALENHILGHVRAGAGPGDQTHARDAGQRTRDVCRTAGLDGRPAASRVPAAAPLFLHKQTAHATPTAQKTAQKTAHATAPAPPHGATRHPRQPHLPPTRKPTAQPHPTPSPQTTFPTPHTPYRQTHADPSLATVPVSPSSPPHFPELGRISTEVFFFSPP